VSGENFHDAEIVRVELVEPELRDDDDADHPGSEAERNGEQRLLDQGRARDLLAELAVRGVAHEERLAGLGDATRDSAAHLRREHFDWRTRLRGCQIAAERDGKQLVSVAQEDSAVVVVDQETQLVGDGETDPGDVVQPGELSREALKHVQVRDRADVVPGRLLGGALALRLVEDHDEPVASCLRSHHRRLRARHELAGVGRVLGAYRHAGGHGQAACGLRFEPADLDPEPLCERHRALEVSGGDDDGELLAANAAHDVGRAHRPAEDVGDLEQELVPDPVAVHVVDLLEVVEIEHHEGDRVALRRCPHQLLPEPVVERAVVVEARERVRRGLVLQPSADVCVVDREGGRVPEARRQQELLLAELRLLADPVDVERPLESAARDERHRDQRLGVHGRARYEPHARVEVCLVREDGLSVLDRPASDPLAEGEGLAHDLVRPLAACEHRDQLALRFVRFVDVDVLVGDQLGKGVRDALEQRVEALLREHVVEDLGQPPVRLGAAGRNQAHLRP